ncbi:MAG TPA: SpoIIE family protein phosphatase, partial [Thermoanaerobaculia bacterium]|nr:SpoIIE family protein phosphatase [Thermoanaerobaculia bacterium]
LRVAGNGDILERIGTGAYPLGVKAPLVWEIQRRRIEPGEALLLHSDGLSEARDPAGNEFGDARIESAIRRAAARPASELVATLSREVMDFCGREAPEDDVSIAAIRRTA